MARHSTLLLNAFEVKKKNSKSSVTVSCSMTASLKKSIENAQSFDELNSIAPRIITLQELIDYFIRCLNRKQKRGKIIHRFALFFDKADIYPDPMHIENKEILQELDSLERCIRELRKECKARSSKEKDLALRHKLKATGYLHNTPKHLLPVIATKILQTLPSEMSLKAINYLKDNSDILQIQQMNKIISSINAEYKNKQKMEAKDDNAPGAALNNNLFSIISNDSITNITNYLTKNEVTSFKAASRRMAIICLEQMEKYEIMTINMNELVDIKYSKYYSNYMNIENELKVNRYCGNRTVSYLKEAWSKQYNIKEEDLLLYSAEISEEDDMFEYYEPCDEYISFANEQQKVCNLAGSCGHEVKCFIFDKSEMIKLDQNGKICDFVAGEEIEFHDLANRRRLKTLLYYDRSTNEITPIQHIMVHANVTGNQLAGYIQNGFVAKNEKQRLFQIKFEEQRKKLNGDTLFLYTHDPQWKFQTDFGFWTKIWDGNKRVAGCSFQTVILSLGSIEIADYPKLGELRAYYSGYDTHNLNSWFGYLYPDEYE